MTKKRLFEMRLRDGLLAATALLLTGGLGFVVGSFTSTTDQNSEFSQLSERLKEDDWPVYLGYCFVFQVPQDTKVKGRPTGHLDVYKDGDVVVTLWPDDRVKSLETPDGYTDIGTLNIGGLNGHLSEQIVDEKFSGQIRVDTNLFRPREVEVRYSDLSQDQRNMALNIANTIRVHRGWLRNTQTWRELGDEPVTEEPLSKPELILPATERGTGTGCRFAGADMDGYEWYID